MSDSPRGAATDSPSEEFARWDRRQIILAAVLTGIGYWAGAKLGLALTFGPQPVSILWPPNAILLGALLIAPRSVWWIVIAAALPAHVLAELQGGVPVPMMLCWYLSNCVEAVLGAALVRHFLPGRPRLDSIRAFGLFLVCATFFATFASSFLDAAFVSWNGWGQSSYWAVWQTRFSSNAMATQAIVPLILAYDARSVRALRNISPRRFVEGALLGVGILTVCLAAFVKPAGSWSIGPDLPYAPLPFLLWAAVRFGWRGLSLCIAAVSFFAIWGAGRGGGPFTSLAPVEKVASVQLFLFLMSVPVWMIAVVIEERRRAEQSARDSQRLLALTIKAARVGVWNADLESGQEWGDDLLLNLFGISPSEATPLAAWTDRIHPEDRERIESDFANARQPNAPRDEQGDSPIPENEFRVLLPDETFRWILSRGAVWRRADGQPYRATGIGMDITERRRAADAIRENEERMALAAAAANIGFWSFEIATREIWLSKHCYTLLGLSSHADDTSAVFESLIQSTGLAGQDDANEDAREGRTSSAHEFRVLWPTGEAHWIVSTARRVGSSSDGSLRVIGMLRDITEQRRAAIEARERHQDLAHLARIATIGELSATIVHEIGQPLGAVMFNAQAASGMLERGDPDIEHLRDIVSDILRDNERAGAVIGQLRKLLRRDELKREKLDLRQVVREALDLVHVELAKQGIELKLNVAGDMPHVLGNRSQLQQVLLNVILNARDAMTEVAVDRRQLEVRVERLADSTAMVSIADSGSGMTVERLGHLFEPFVTSKTHGLGLGLAISRSIMLEHGGDLRAETVTEGAVLHLTLPAFEASQVADVKPKTDYELRTASLPTQSDYTSPAQAPPS